MNGPVVGVPPQVQKYSEDPAKVPKTIDSAGMSMQDRNKLMHPQKSMKP